MMKLAWQMKNNPEKLWVQIMRTKYACGVQPIPSVGQRSKVSSVWRAIAHAWQYMDSRITWVIRNGHDTHFWRDPWIHGCGRLEEHFIDSVSAHELNYPVSFYVTEMGWRWNVLHNLLPPNVCAKIAATDENFSIKSAYVSLSEEYDPVQGRDVNPIFQKVWQWVGPQRIRTFLWKLSHGRLLTNAERVNRGMT